MIRFESVSKRYAPQFDALRELSFELPTGEMAFLTGHSGAGKSTLLKLIMLIERASSGRVIVNDRDHSQLKGNQIALARRDIGMIYQDHNLLDDRSVYDNVALPLIIAGMQPRDIPNRVYAALDLVGLKHRAKSQPFELSGGEQQRVGIALRRGQQTRRYSCRRTHRQPRPRAGRGDHAPVRAVQSGGCKHAHRQSRPLADHPAATPHSHP